MSDDGYSNVSGEKEDQEKDDDTKNIYDRMSKTQKILFWVVVSLAILGLLVGVGYIVYRNVIYEVPIRKLIDDLNMTDEGFFLEKSVDEIIARINKNPKILEDEELKNKVYELGISNRILSEQKDKINQMFTNLTNKKQYQAESN